MKAPEDMSLRKSAVGLDRDSSGGDRRHEEKGENT